MCQFIDSCFGCGVYWYVSLFLMLVYRVYVNNVVIVIMVYLFNYGFGSEEVWMQVYVNVILLVVFIYVFQFVVGVIGSVIN